MLRSPRVESPARVLMGPASYMSIRMGSPATMFERSFRTDGSGPTWRRRFFLVIGGATLLMCIAGITARVTANQTGPTVVRQADPLNGNLEEDPSAARHIVERSFDTKERVHSAFQGTLPKNVEDGIAQKVEREIEKKTMQRLDQLVMDLQEDMRDEIARHVKLEVDKMKSATAGLKHANHKWATCAWNSLASNERIVFFLHDDDSVDDLPNSAKEIARGFDNGNAAYIGNRKLADLQLTGLRICLEESPASPGDCNHLCYDVRESDWSFNGTGLPAELAGPLRGVVAALSGQLDQGATEDGARGAFVETPLRGEGHCQATSDSPGYCWTCPSERSQDFEGKVGQWKGAEEVANWHVGGNGMMLHRDSRGDELRWHGRTCSGTTGPWDTFYVVAKTAGAPSELKPPSAAAAHRLRKATSPSSSAPTTSASSSAPTTTLAPRTSTTDSRIDSLFCFSVMNAANYELSLMRSQLSKGAGIFGCDEWSVFSDRSTWLSPGPPVRIEATILDIRVKAVAGTSTHFLNTDVFTKAWAKIREEGKYRDHDWVVKVDPDAVFFPGRLRSHVRDISLEERSRGVYILNCHYTDGKYWFFGALEVISKPAVDAYHAGSARCMGELDRGVLGEDTWLRKCLDLLGVEGVRDTGVLSDGYCNEAPSPCVSGKAAFHPFKSPEAYFNCWAEAKPSGVHLQ